jgi:DNA-binding NtrC family response regulator
MSADAGIAIADEKIERALQKRREGVPSGAAAGSWLLESPRMAALLPVAAKISAMPTAPVILTGEPGTGTAELARWIHAHDPVSCNARFMQTSGHLAIPAELQGRPLAGTLFVDDIENLRSATQAWLLNLVSERETRRAPVRVVAGTRRDVPDLLALQHLSHELIHALDVTRVKIPPLRERLEEILPLAYRFLHVFAERVGKPLSTFSVAAESKLLSYDYPANVRELRNVVERAAVLEESNEVQVASIVFYSEQATTAEPSPPVRRIVGRERYPSLAEVERDYLVMLLRQLRGCRAEVSRAMGVSYPTVLKKIARHGLDVAAIVAASADVPGPPTQVERAQPYRGRI